MKNTKLNIFLKPSYDSIVEKLGFDIEEDNYDNDLILFHQGYNIVEAEILCGQKFTIPTNYEDGVISCEEIKYKFIYKNDDEWDDDDENKDPDSLILKPGNYLFHEDGITIEKLCDVFEDEDDIICDSPEELIWNAITNKAKTKFDFNSFAENFNNINEEIADNILFMSIFEFANGESKEIIAFKIQNQILMTGYKININEIHAFLSDKEELLGLEIYAAQLASDLLRDGNEPIEVLKMVKQLL